MIHQQSLKSTAKSARLRASYAAQHTLKARIHRTKTVLPQAAASAIVLEVRYKLLHDQLRLEGDRYPVDGHELPLQALQLRGRDAAHGQVSARTQRTSQESAPVCAGCRSDLRRVDNI